MKTISALFLAVLVSCAALKADLIAFKDGAVTCLKSDEPAAQALGLELVTIAAADLFRGKSPDDTFKDVTAQAEVGAKAQGVPVAACAFDGAVTDIERLLHPVAPAGTVVQALTFPDEAQLALAAFEMAHGVTSVSR